MRWRSWRERHPIDRCGKTGEWVWVVLPHTCDGCGKRVVFERMCLTLYGYYSGPESLYHCNRCAHIEPPSVVRGRIMEDLA